MSNASRLPAEPPMTVDAALRVSALRRGAPEVLAGADQLGRTVRWAHSCEARHVPGLLEGDELLLMTGMGLGTAPADLRAFVRDLVARRVAALVIELGHVYRQLPAPLVQEARRLRLPLVALHEEVRFVEVTRQLHTAILTRQLTIERRVTDLHAALTARLLAGAGIPALLGALAGAIGNPVLLDRAGEVVFHAAHGAQAEELLAQWELLRPRLDAGERAAAASAAVPGSGDRPWGRLVAVPHTRPTDALARSAIERIAPLLALALARAGEEQALEGRERGNFLDDVMTGRIAPEDMPVRSHQLGFGDPRRMLGVVAVRPTHPGGGSTRPDQRAPGTLRDVRDALRAVGITGLLGLRPMGDDLVMLVGVPPGMHRETAVEHVVAALRGAGDGRAAALTIAAGPIAAEWAEVPAALRDAAETADTMRDAAPRRWHDATRADVDRLLWSLRDDEGLATFARQRLAPLLEHDEVRSAVLLPTLRALCECHWQKAEAARALGIQRQSLYARMGRLRDVLGTPLDEPETRFGLELAIRALRT